MDYYIISKNELTHYGVKGMKWGIRHDPDRIGFRRSKSIDGSTSKRRKGLSRAQKIAFGIGAVAAVAGIGYLAYRSGKFDRIITIGKQRLNRQGIVNGNVAKIKESEQSKSIANKLADVVQPQDRLCNFNSFGAGASNESISVSLNDNAKEQYINSLSTLLNKSLKNTEGRLETPAASAFATKESMTNAIVKSFKIKDPTTGKLREGAAGQIGSDLTKGTGGHAFNWKVENGEMKFFDIHASRMVIKNNKAIKVYEPRNDVSNYFGSEINGKHGVITRLDGLNESDFTEEGLKLFNVKSHK